MNLAILKRERAVRGLPLSAGLSLLLGLVTLPILRATEIPRSLGAGLEADSGGTLDAQLLSTILLVFVLQVGLVGIRRIQLQHRVQEFERILPIGMRSIVFQRMGAQWLAFALPAVIIGLIWATRVPAGELGTLALVLVNVLIGLAFAVALLFAYRTRAASIRVVETALVAVVAVVAVVAPTLSELPWTRWVAPVGAAGLFAWLWNVLPVAVPPDDPAASASGEARASASPGVRLFGPLRWTLIRSAILRPSVLITQVFGVVVLVAMGTENPFFLLWLPALMVDGAVRIGMNLLHATDALPMRRTRLLRYIALPPLAALGLGLASASWFPPVHRSTAMLSNVVAIDGQSERTLDGRAEYADHVRVPPHHWRVASSADEARVTAPWGEVSDPVRHPVTFGSDTFVFCPFDVQPENSGRFLMWQLQRALAVVHGYEGTPEDVHATWFPNLDLDRPIADARIREQDATDWGLTPPRLHRLPNAAGFLALWAALLWVAIAAYSLRPNVPPTRNESLVRVLRSPWLIGGLFIALLLGFSEIESRDGALLRVLASQLHRALDGALRSSPLLWVAVVAAVAGLGFGFLVRRIRRIEVPPLVVNGWTKKAMSIY